MAKTVDLLMNLDIHPDSNQLLVKSEERSIADSLRTRVLIGKNERPFEQTGSIVREIVFEQFSEQTTDNIRETVKEAVSQETRARIIEVEVLPQPMMNRYVINIYYQTNFSPTQQKLAVVLYRVR